MFTDSYFELFLLLGIILIIADFFIQTDLLICLGLGSFALAINSLFNLPPLYQIILGTIIWLGLIGLHFAFFKSVIAKYTNKVLTPDVIESHPMDRYIGHSSIVESIEGRQLIRLDNELISFESSDPIPSGTQVTVIAMSDGFPSVQAVPASS